MNLRMQASGLQIPQHCRRQCGIVHKIWVSAFRTGFSFPSAIYNLCEFGQVLNLSEPHGLKMLGGLNESVCRDWRLTYSKHSHVRFCLLCDFSAVVQKAAFECSGYRWKAQSIASQKWLRTDLYCLRFILLHFFFFSWRACSPCLLKRLYLVAVNRLLAKWLFNSVRTYSALTIEMQIKT